jgi:hypothetical protein
MGVEGTIVVLLSGMCGWVLPVLLVTATGDKQFMYRYLSFVWCVEVASHI